MFNAIRISLLLSLASLASCSGNIDDTIHSLDKTVEVNDNDTVETFFCWAWETLTGHKLGMSLEDLAYEENMPMDMVVIIVQNWVEKAHQMGASRQDAIEVLLYEAGYDDKIDGEINVTKEVSKEVDKRLRAIARQKKAYLAKRGKKKRQ